MADEAHHTPPNLQSQPDAIQRNNASPPVKKRRWITAGVVLLAAVGLVTAFVWLRKDIEQSPSAHAAPPIPVVAATAHKGDVGVYVTGLGSVTPLNTVAIKTRVDGQLTSVSYKEGQTVRKGAALVEIDPRPFQVQLAQAEAQLAKDQAALVNARTDLQRYQDLIARNAVAQQVLETQKATVAQDEGTVKGDQANIDSAKLNITYCHIVAPITGRVGLRLVDPGNMVSAAAANPLIVITQTQPISVIFAIPEQQLAAVRGASKGRAPLHVDVVDRDGHSMLASGELTTLDNQIDQPTGTLKLRATVPNKDEALFPNQFVNARLLVQNKQGVTLVPNAAIQRNGSMTFVYLVKGDRSVSVRNVTVGTTSGDESEIASGISPGDVVVVQGVDKLQEGTKVAADVQTDDEARRAGSQPADAVGTSGQPGAKRPGTAK